MTATEANPNQQEHPALPRRLAAILYDTFLVLPLIMAGVALAMGIRAWFFGAVEGDLGQAELNPQLVQLIILIVIAGFFSWFWIRNGQTLGMQAWRIKLVSNEGGPITVRMAIVRTLGATFSAACLGLGYLWSLVDSNRRCWHDHLSGTELILLPKPEKKNKKASKENP
ncbi:MAG: RDD family protein [Halioglobus sp.]